MFVFFFKQKTAYEMRISDWSSDVCSSDLRRAFVAIGQIAPELQQDSFAIADHGFVDAIEMQGAEGVAVECGHGDMKMRQGFDSSRFQEGCHQRPWRTGARPTGQGPSAHRSEKKKAARRQHGDRAVYKIVQDFLQTGRAHV